MLARIIRKLLPALIGGSVVRVSLVAQHEGR